MSTFPVFKTYPLFQKLKKKLYNIEIHFIDFPHCCIYLFIKHIFKFIYLNFKKYYFFFFETNLSYFICISVSVSVSPIILRVFGAVVRVQLNCKIVTKTTKWSFAVVALLLERWQLQLSVEQLKRSMISDNCFAHAHDSLNSIFARFAQLFRYQIHKIKSTRCVYFCFSPFVLLSSCHPCGAYESQWGLNLDWTIFEIRLRLKCLLLLLHLPVVAVHRKNEVKRVSRKAAKRSCKRT